MPPQPQNDSADEHLARWGDLFPDPTARDAQVEGALTRMSAVMRAVHEDLRELLADHPITQEEFITLHALGGLSRACGAPVTPAQLAERTGVTRAGMTSRLDRLERAGLITREPHPQDRRSTQIVTTADGLRAWEDVIHHWQASERALFERLSTAELTTLNRLLRTVVLQTERD